MITFRHMQHVKFFGLWSTLEVVDQMCSIKKVFLTATSLKKKLRHRCIPVNLAKMFRTLIAENLQNTFRQLLLSTLNMSVRMRLAKHHTKFSVFRAVSNLTKVLWEIKSDSTFLDSQKQIEGREKIRCAKK